MTFAVVFFFCFVYLLSPVHYFKYILLPVFMLYLFYKYKISNYDYLCQMPRVKQFNLHVRAHRTFFIFCFVITRTFYSPSNLEGSGRSLPRSNQPSSRGSNFDWNFENQHLNLSSITGSRMWGRLTHTTWLGNSFRFGSDLTAPSFSAQLYSFEMIKFLRIFIFAFVDKMIHWTLFKQQFYNNKLLEFFSFLSFSSRHSLI